MESILNNFYNILSKLTLVDAERGDCSELNIWQNDSRLKMLKLHLWKWAAHVFGCSYGPTLKYNFPMPSYPDLSSMGIISLKFWAGWRGPLNCSMSSIWLLKEFYQWDICSGQSGDISIVINIDIYINQCIQIIRWFPAVKSTDLSLCTRCVGP